MLRARIYFEIPKDSKPGDKYRVTVMQKEGTKILGDSTYEIRIKEEGRK